MKFNQKLTMTLFALYLVCAVAQGILSVAIGNILDEFSIQSTFQGVPNASSQFGYLISFLIIPFLQNRASKPAILCMGIALSFAMQLLLGFCPSQYAFFICICFCGIAMGFMETGINSMVIENNPAESSRKVNLLHMCYSIGATCCPVLITFVITNYGWRSMYTISSLVLGAFLIVMMLFFRKSGAKKPVEKTGGDELPLKNLLLILKDRSLLLIIAACAIYTAAQYTLVNWIVIYLVNDVGVSAQNAAISLSFLWGGIILSRFCASRLRVDALKLFFVTLTLCFPVMIVCFAVGSYVSVCIAAFVFGVLCGHSIPTLTAWLGSHNQKNTITILAANNFIVGILGVLWPLLVATIKSALSLKFAFILTAILLLISAFFAYYVNRQNET